MADYWEKTLRDLGLKPADPEADAQYAHRNDPPMVFPGYTAPLADKSSSSLPPSIASVSVPDAGDDDQDIPTGNKNLQALINNSDYSIPDGEEEGMPHYYPSHTMIPSPDRRLGVPTPDKEYGNDHATYIGPENSPVMLGKGKRVSDVPMGPPDPMGALLGTTQKDASKDYLGGLLDSVYGSGLNDKALQNAQKSRDTQELYAQLAKAGSQVGAAISGIKPTTDIQDHIIKSSSQGVEDIITRRKGKQDEYDMSVKLSDFSDKKALKDSESSISKAYRAFAKQAAPELAQDPSFENLSAQGVKELLPGIDLMMKMKATSFEKQKYAEEKHERELIKNEPKVEEAVNKALSPRGPIGAAEKAEQLIERVLTIANDKTPNDKIKLQLLANDLDAAIKGGAGTVGGAAKLVSKTLDGTLGEAKAFLSNKPEDANLKPFIDRLATIAKEMKTTLRASKKPFIENIIDSYKNNVTPEKYADMRKRHLSKYEEEEESSSTLPPGLDKNRAMAELKKRGIKH